MNEHGFTLTEVVIVLILAAILAAFVVPRLPNLASIEGPGATQALAASIDRTQQLSSLQQCSFAIALSPQGYQVERAQDCQATTACFAPYQDQQSAPNHASGIRLLVQFGQWYQVSPSGCIDLNNLGTPIDPSAPLMLSTGALTLHGQTGYVEP